jgi:ribosomal protein S18 acetylase RimI-like enzyme
MGETPAVTEIRGYRPEDHDGVYDVCLRTGASGEDASHLVRDFRLLGHLYAGPYVALAPDLAFVVVDGQGVGGYILGALDTVAFEAQLEEEWWPPLRERYPRPPSDGEPVLDDLLIALMHDRPAPDAKLVGEYPSHLHIDLLPRLQGRGWGRRLVGTLTERLRAAGSPGVHLGVAADNTRAHAFYRAVGFTEWQADSVSIIYAMRL